MKPYKTFLLPFDTTKLNLFMRNNSVASDDEEAPKDSESSIDRKKSKEKVVAPIPVKNYLKNLSIKKRKPMNHI